MSIIIPPTAILTKLSCGVKLACSKSLKPSPDCFLYGLTQGNKRTILFVWVLFLLFAVATTEWISVSSDSVEVFDTVEGKVSHLRGTVVVVIGEIVITGSEALVYEVDEKAMILNSTASDEKIVLTGDTLTYYRQDDRAVVSGRARLKTADEIIYADTLTYLRKKKKVRGKGKLRVVSLKEDTMITGGEGEYDLERRWGRLTGSPVLTVKGKEDTRVESESMWIDQEGHITSAAGNVNVSMRSGSVSCDSLRYDLSREVACMWGHPRIEGENGWMVGDTIEVLLRNREVIRTVVVGSASGRYELSGGGVNVIKGDTIEVFFTGGEMQSILVKGSAEGKYIEGTED